VNSDADGGRTEVDVGGDSSTAVEVPVEPASLVQIVIGRLLDVNVVATAGLLVVWAEALFRHGGLPACDGALADCVADWVTANPDAALRAAAGAIVFGVAYHLLAARRGGRTLGRTLTGTVLVRSSGHPLSWPLLLLRGALALVSLGFFGAGFYWVLLDPLHRTWHDRLTGTVVVRRRVRLR
jgi:uncharacterized RDD family membrane protein YckC